MPELDSCITCGRPFPPAEQGSQLCGACENTARLRLETVWDTYREGHPEPVRVGWFVRFKAGGGLTLIGGKVEWLAPPCAPGVYAERRLDELLAGVDPLFPEHSDDTLPPPWTCEVLVTAAGPLLGRAVREA